MTREEIVVGLDIGTTKVGTVIAAGDVEGSLRIIGVGSTPSRGIKRGVVVDVEETVAAIQHSVERAAHMAGIKVEGVIVGVTGEHIESSNRHAAVTVAGGQGAITREDVRRVLQAAALEVPRDREIIHSLPRSFSVDGHMGVRRPLGMTGQKLEVETHIVTGKAPYLQNAVQCVERAGLKVEALVLEPIATAEAVTTADEREMGVILIDIGGGTSDLAVFHDGSIVYSGVLPVGGNHVTRDIAIGLRTPFEIAEELKIESGAATREMIPHGEALEITLAGSNERLRIPRAILGEIIEARMSELFELSREMMHRSGARKRLPGGVILSGGGALLPGAVELANSVFSMPVRLGYPRNISGWSDQVSMPQLATGVGLCRFSLTQRQSPNNQLVIPPIAALEGRRIWGAIAGGEETGARAPGFTSATQPQTRDAPKNSLLIDAAPGVTGATPIVATERTSPDKTVSLAPANAPSDTSPDAAKPSARNLAEQTLAESMPGAAPNAAPDEASVAPPNETPRANEFEAPRFEARPAQSRGENSRPIEPAGDASARAASRKTHRNDPASLGATTRRAPLRTENSTRNRSDNSPSESRETSDIFRRADPSPASQEPRKPLNFAEIWWNKLKDFLGFEKIGE